MNNRNQTQQQQQKPASASSKASGRSRSKALFELGAVVATPAALEQIEVGGDVGFIAAMRLVRRHVTGDFGQLCDEDRQENEFSIAHGFRVMSVYDLPSGKVWVITEHDRSATTVLLPSDY